MPMIIVATSHLEIDDRAEGKDAGQLGYNGSGRLKSLRANKSVNLVKSDFRDCVMRIIATVPVYNEVDIIGQVLEHLSTQGVDFVVLDGGSHDGSAEIGIRTNVIENLHVVVQQVLALSAQPISK